MENAVREKAITKVSIVGIGANLLLVLFKAAVGFFSGSIAIILDAVNNLTDALSSVVTIVGVKLARRKPDKKHPFGYGRTEYISAVIISAIVLTAGAASLSQSVRKIFAPELPDFSIVSIVIIAAATVVKFLLGRYVKAEGVKYNSDALVASGSDASFDSLISASTLLGAAITLIFRISLDGYIGAAISLFIIKAGLEMLAESLGSVMGSRSDSETTKEIKETIRAIDGVMGAYDLILHDYGPDYAIGSVHVEIPDSLSAGDIHDLTREIQNAVIEKFRVFLTVGIYAVDSSREKERSMIADAAMKHEGVLGIHGVFFSEKEDLVSFDVLIDFTVRDREALQKALTEELGQLMPGKTIFVNFDTNYTD